MGNLIIKYRPKTMGELLGNDYIKRLWAGYVARNSYPRSMILHSNYGMGKTTIGKILAREITINKCPLNHSYTEEHLEIDATRYHELENIEGYLVLMYGGIFRPFSSFIDEAQRLSPKAQQLFLKPIEDEKFPTFIFATTDIGAIDKGILSRSVKFYLKNPDKHVLVENLADIAGKEKIDISAEAINLITEHAGCNVRDSLTYLEQAMGYGGKIDVEVIKEIIEQENPLRA